MGSLFRCKLLTYTFVTSSHNKKEKLANCLEHFLHAPSHSQTLKSASAQHSWHRRVTLVQQCDKLNVVMCEMTMGRIHWYSAKL